MVSFVLLGPLLPWFTMVSGLGVVSVQFVFSFPLGAGIVPLDEGMVVLVEGVVSLVAGMVVLVEGVVSLVAGMVVLVGGVVSLVAGMVVLLVLQEIMYTGIVNMISRHLWVWFVEVMLDEVLLTAGLEEFCKVLLEDVTLALLQLVPLMVSLVDPSGAGTVLFEETVVVFTHVEFSVVVVLENPFEVVVLEEDSFEEDTFEEDSFEEVTFEEVTFEEVTFEEVSEHAVSFEEDDTFDEDPVHVPFTMRAREGSHNVAL